MTVWGLDIGTFSFFVFSFAVGLFVALQAAFGCREETRTHRIVRGLLGAAYVVVTVVAFMQLEGVESPYVTQ